MSSSAIARIFSAIAAACPARCRRCLPSSPRAMLSTTHRSSAFGADQLRHQEDPRVIVLEEVKAVLGQTLQLGDKWNRFNAATGLFGAIPEFDSMAVVTVVTAIEERF